MCASIMFLITPKGHRITVLDMRAWRQLGARANDWGAGANEVARDLKLCG
jgi:hypothetical protein